MRRLIPRGWTATGVGLVVAGAVLLALGAEVASLFVGGVGAILLMGVAFYVVGRSEEIERDGRDR